MMEYMIDEERQVVDVIVQADKMGKISGTTLPALMGISPWKSPFQASLEVMGVYREDVKNDAVHAGHVIEGKIFDWLMSQDYLVRPAKDIWPDINMDGPYESWGQHVDDPIFGAHVDGLEFNEVQIDVDKFRMSESPCGVVEIKTTRRIEDYAQGAPDHVKMQAFHYAYMLGLREVVIILGVVTEEQQKDPSTWSPEGNVFEYRYDVPDDFQDVHDQAVRMYYTMQKGISLPWDANNKRDMAILDKLRVKWISPADGVSSNIDIAEAMEKYAAEKVREQAIIKQAEPHKKAAEGYAKAIKEYSDQFVRRNGQFNKVAMETPYGIVTVLQKTTSEWDEEAMRADGIDPSKYKRQKVSWSMDQVRELK